MKISFGSSRIVFIFSHSAIKIPRIRILYPLRRFLEHRKNKRVGIELEKFGPNIVMATLNYFLVGFYANRIEILYSKNNSSAGINPTKGILWGAIVIQSKGEVVMESDVRWIKIQQMIQKRGIAEHDTGRSCNFCIIGNRIRMVDYGRKETIFALDQSNLKILEQFGAT